ncbi:MAG: hypothetical protein ABSA30_00075 [Candidatus Aminicenantales bacterium]|jgi:hypothetical protein
MTQSIRGLFGAFPGDTCWIVGTGPSLVRASAPLFGPGPVIALNASIRPVEALGLPNPVFSMQKDGCGFSGPHAACRNSLTVRPQKAPLLVSRAESFHCFAEYRPRYVFDAVADLGAPAWWEFSANCAIHLARLMGCVRIRLVAFDSCTSGDLTNFEGEENPLYAQQRPRMLALLGPEDRLIEVRS